MAGNLPLYLAAPVRGARWHVFLNPYSGTKKSLKTWLQFADWLDVAGVVATVTQTEYAGHCQDAVRELDISAVDLIISVSGDGMLHELINGIMKRDDWHKATKVPIGVIPCGTGNALASSLMYPTPIISILTLIKRQWRPFDLMAAYQYTPPLEASMSAPALVVAKPNAKPSIAPAAASHSRAPSSPAAIPDPSPKHHSAADGGLDTPNTPVTKTSSKKKLKKKTSKEIGSVTPASDSTKTPTASTSLGTTDTSVPTPAHDAGLNRALSADHLSSPHPPHPPLSAGLPTSASTSKLQTKAAAARQARQVATQPGTWNLICYSFQALMWGIVSDVDIETEPWRWMGDFRFTLGSLRRVAAMRHYPARLLTLDSVDAGDHMTTCQFHSACASCSSGLEEHYSRHERLEKHYTETETQTEKVVIDKKVIVDGDKILSEEKTVLLEVETEIIADKPSKRKRKKNLEAVPEDPVTTIEEVTEPVKEKKTKSAAVESSEAPESKEAEEDLKASLSAHLEDAAPVASPSTKHKRKGSKKKAKIEEASSHAPGEDQVAEPSLVSADAHSKPYTGPILRGLAKGLENLINFDPMQADAEIDNTAWSEITTKFVYFVASNVSHIGTDLRVAPFAHACGGAVDVVYADEIPKLSMIDLLTSLEDGRYVGHSSVTYKKVKAFMLIPTGKPGVIDLDGEEYEPLPTAIEVHTGVLRMCVAVWNLELPAESA